MMLLIIIIKDADFLTVKSINIFFGTGVEIITNQYN